MHNPLITNETQYKKYLDEIDRLMDLSPSTNTPESERLLLLAIAIQEYESKRFFFKKPTAIEAIRFRMDEEELKQKDLIPFIGSKSKVSEVLAGKRNLTPLMIRNLHEHLGISLDLLIQQPKISKKKLAKKPQEAVTRSIKPPIHPGEILLEEFMKPLNISQYKLAKALHIGAIRLSEIIRGKRSITADTAIRLGRYFEMESKFWMNLQASYDLEVAMIHHSKAIYEEVKPLKDAA